MTGSFMKIECIAARRFNGRFLSGWLFRRSRNLNLKRGRNVGASLSGPRKKVLHHPHPVCADMTYRFCLFLLCRGEGMPLRRPKARQYSACSAVPNKDMHGKREPSSTTSMVLFLAPFQWKLERSLGATCAVYISDTNAGEYPGIRDIKGKAGERALSSPYEIPK